MTDAQTLIQSIRSRDRISDEDLLELRRAFGSDLTLSAAEADAIFALNDISDKSDGWGPYFTSILAAYVDDRQAPQDYVSRSSSDWLIDKISADGIVETQTELELLLNVLRTANHVPPELQKFALGQVIQAVTSGEGVVHGNMRTPGQLGEAEVDLLRRVLYAVSSDGGIGITRTEAEALFTLNDAVSGRDNHPSWQSLFVQAIANYLMMSGVPVIPSPENALLHQQWLVGETEKERWSFFRSFKHMLDQRRARKTDDGTGSYANLDSGAVAQSEAIDLGEADWLIERLSADGQQDTNEAALLRFLKDESPAIDAALRAHMAES